MQLAVDSSAILAHYCRAWWRHGVRFGITGEHRRLEQYAALCTAWCGTPEGMHGGMREEAMERIVLLSGDFLMFRFPHGHPDRERRGRVNPGFLDAVLLRERYAGLFVTAGPETVFLLSLAPIYATDAIAPGQFVRRLALFLDALPPGRRYAVQVRNGELLVPEYFAMLRSRQSIPVLGEGIGMPPLPDQVALTGAAGAVGLIARLSVEKDPELHVAVRAMVRQYAGEAPVTVLLEDRADVALRVLLTLMEELDDELARRSVIRRGGVHAPHHRIPDHHNAA
jgi:hypothetical protein